MLHCWASTYSGGKMTLAKHILPYMTPCGRIYCEPFAGLGNLYGKAALTLQFDEWRLNDIRTSNFFRALATQGDSLEVPARSHEEFNRQNAAFKLGDPPAILLGPYLTRKWR
jgi:site-specific DNA-adenine methylase